MPGPGTIMLVQIYETSSPEEAAALARLGVDHVGILVGDGSFPREQSIEAAHRILSAVPPPSRLRRTTESAPSILDFEGTGRNAVRKIPKRAKKSSSKKMKKAGRVP